MKESPTLKLVIGIWIAKLGLVGLPASALTFIASLVLGSMLDKAIIKIDVFLDTIREAMKDPKWRDEATKLYNKASSRVYTEKEKDEIRKQYLDALGDYASLADRLRK